MTNWQHADIFSFDSITKVKNEQRGASDHDRKRSSHNLRAVEEGEKPGGRISARSAIIGVGGAGITMLSKLPRAQLKAKYYAVSTHLHELNYFRGHNKILIGKLTSRGLGAHDDPLIGKAAFEEDRQQIEHCLNGVDIIVFLAGLGGGTGTGALPSLAKLARSKGLLTIAMVTMPFPQEGIVKQQNTLLGLHRLSQNIDALFVFRGDRLQRGGASTSYKFTFERVDNSIAWMVRTLNQISSARSRGDLQFSHLSQLLTNAGRTAFAFIEGNSRQDAAALADSLFENSLSDLDFSECHDALLRIRGDSALRHTLSAAIASRLPEKTNLTCGYALDGDMGETVQIALIGTTRQSQHLPVLHSFSERRSVASSAHNPAFDIREFELPFELNAEEVEARRGEEVPPTVSTEIQHELTLLRTAIAHLVQRHNTEEQLNTVSEVSSILAMSPEIMGETPASELLHATVGLAEDIIAGHSTLSAAAISTLRLVPETLAALMIDKHIAAAEASALLEALAGFSVAPGRQSEVRTDACHTSTALIAEDTSFFYDLLNV